MTGNNLLGVVTLRHDLAQTDYNTEVRFRVLIFRPKYMKQFESLMKIQQIRGILKKERKYSFNLK
jgi:hypothetical protein